VEESTEEDFIAFYIVHSEMAHVAESYDFLIGPAARISHFATPGDMES
jgi:hypothetical protein